MNVTATVSQYYSDVFTANTQAKIDECGLLFFPVLEQHQESVGFGCNKTNCTLVLRSCNHSSCRTSRISDGTRIRGRGSSYHLKMEARKRNNRRGKWNFCVYPHFRFVLLPTQQNCMQCGCLFYLKADLHYFKISICAKTTKYYLHSSAMLMSVFDYGLCSTEFGNVYHHLFGVSFITICSCLVENISQIHLGAVRS